MACPSLPALTSLNGNSCYLVLHLCRRQQHLDDTGMLLDPARPSVAADIELANAAAAAGNAIPLITSRTIALMQMLSRTLLLNASPPDDPEVVIVGTKTRLSMPPNCTSGTSAGSKETDGVASLFLTGTIGTTNKWLCESGASSLMSSDRMAFLDYSIVTIPRPWTWVLTCWETW